VRLLSVTCLSRWGRPGGRGSGLAMPPSLYPLLQPALGLWGVTTTSWVCNTNPHEPWSLQCSHLPGTRCAGPLGPQALPVRKKMAESAASMAGSVFVITEAIWSQT